MAVGRYAGSELRRFVSVRRALDDARRVPINLRMCIPSLSILAVYPRTLEGALSLALVSRPRGRRRLRMPNRSGDSPNGSPVHRIQGVSKMHKTQVDLVPIGRTLDEVSRIDGDPSDCTASIAILDEAESLHGVESFWAMKWPRRYVLARLGHGRNGERELRNRFVASEGAIPSGLFWRGVGEGSRVQTPYVHRVSALIGGSANSELLT